MNKPFLEKALKYLPDGHETFIALAEDIDFILELAHMVSFSFSIHLALHCILYL
jgi:hypothetical protein